MVSSTLQPADGAPRPEKAPLYIDRGQSPEAPTSEWLLERFLEYVEGAGLELYPAQEEAILEIAEGRSVILNTPTGSGKSLVALAACFCSLARDERAYYTAPIKALVSEKFLSLCRVFGAENVGMMTGDATVNHEAPIICCTAEILSNLALRKGAEADVEWVVMDEFHFYSDRERGVAWQIPLITLPQARFLLMSATLGDTTLFKDTIEEHTGRPCILVRSEMRPVPLDYAYVETPLHETIQDLMNEGRAPVYIVHFSQRAASEQAQRLTSLDFLSKEQKQVLREELVGFRFDSPFGQELKRFIPHGIGVHHAGMLPKYRLLVEKLAQKGLLKVICGTDTLGVGINIPLRTVLFTQLCKYDGQKTRILSVRDFHQIAGRAGRRGFDTQGSVVVQAPEHVIENLQAKRKADGDAKKLRKLRPKKAPERGYVPWDAGTLKTLREAPPEGLKSRFFVSHGMLLNVLCRTHEDGCKAMKRLIDASHESPRARRQHRRTAIAMFRAQKDAQVVEVTEAGVRVHGDLQEDFSLNHALSLYAVEVIDSLDRDEPGYALTVVSVIEAILENPGIILLRQVDVLKGRRMAEMKQAGMEYEERLEELAKVDYEKPERELLEATFEAFCSHHPWVLGQSIAPKSILRDLSELGLSFNAYIKEYGLERAEGVLLRYLSEAYRALEHTVPDAAKTEPVLDIIEWLGALLRRTDGSLLEEWQKLNDPLGLTAKEEDAPEVHDITKNVRAFSVLVQNAIWRVVVALARQDYLAALGALRALSGGEVPLNVDELTKQLAPFFDEYAEMLTGPDARAKKHCVIELGKDTWGVRQTLCDPEEDHGFALRFSVDIEKSREAEAPVALLVGIERA